MKKLIFFYLLVLISYTGFTQEKSVKEHWKPLLAQEGLAQYFSGIFESLGIQIEETNEQLTILHKTDHFEIVDGINETDVDYSVKLKMENIKNMSAHGADGKIDPYESYRIMSVLFTPLTNLHWKILI